MADVSTESLAISTAVSMAKAYTRGTGRPMNVYAVKAMLSELDRLRDLLQDARGYITPTISTHEDISEVLGWCDCGYCRHVPHRGSQ